MGLRLSAVSAAIGALALAGCANWNAVKKDFMTKHGAAVSIDAKQRAIYSVEVRNGDGATRDVVCAEPSPDAMSSLAANLGLDAASAVKSLGLAFSSQEAAASIGLRTQTIQTLRDAMYRLCEGYAGGALDDVGFVRLQRRYQAVMLGLLAIEQLTGATVANQATLGGKGSARLGNSLGKVSSMITDGRQKQIAAQADVAAKKAAVAAKTKEVADAEAAFKKATDEGQGQETAALKTAREAHKARSDELATLEAARTKAQQAEAVATGDIESLEQLRKELDRASAVGEASAQLSGAANTASGPADSTAAVRIAEAVEKIVTTIVSHDYGKEACMDWLLSRSMRDSFTLGDKRNLSLAELQVEMCREDRKMAHEIELAKIQAKAMVAAVEARAAQLVAAAAPPVDAVAPAAKPQKPAPAPKPQPSPKPLAPPKPPGKPEPQPAKPSPVPAPKPAPAAAAPAPSASSAEPATPTAVPPSPPPVAQQPSSGPLTNPGARIKEIIEGARREEPSKRPTGEPK